ncbi:MAG: DUF885 domain-containing protein [Anaerolineae bacterium]|nr:DUF885 domain-containing protein [Gemmatimonadaceae bacterium]
MTRRRADWRELVAAACLAGMSALPQPCDGQLAPSSATAQVHQLSEEYLAAYQRRYPEMGAGRPVSALFDNSRTAYTSWARTERHFLSRLARIAGNVDAVSPEAVTLALLKERLEASQTFEGCRRELWNVSPVTGWLSEHRGYAVQQPVGDQARRSAALKRWRQLPAFIDTEIANLRFGQSLGFSAPRMLVSTTVAQLDRVLAAPVRESPFYAPALRDTTPAFRDAFERLVRLKITRAIRRYRAFLQDEYLPAARETVGVSHNPGGQACFRALIRRYTSLSSTPAELDSMGRALLDRGMRERAGTQVEQGALPKQQSLHEKLVADSANTFRSAHEVITYAQDAMQRAWSIAPQWFGQLPAVSLPGIDSLPGGDGSDPTAQYVAASQGDARSAVLLNLSALLKPGGKLYLERVMFHEGVPGHHFQIALQQASSVNALNRVLWSSAFVEGWAVYSSNLADEMGLYTSTASRFPLVEAVVNDGLTFVVQSGLHAHGWSRTQAIDTMLAYSADSRAEVEQEVDYYIAAPAHALAYPVGARAIDRLRTDAKLQLGSRFDVRRFHDSVLSSGPVPLGTLRSIIAKWIAREQAQAR